MSMSPLQWRELVNEHYTTLSDFEDSYTVSHVRDQIQKERQNNKELLEIAEAYPGALKNDQIIEIQNKDKQLQNLDNELEQWQTAPKVSNQKNSTIAPA